MIFTHNIVKTVCFPQQCHFDSRRVKFVLLSRQKAMFKPNLSKYMGGINHYPAFNLTYGQKKKKQEEKGGHTTCDLSTDNDWYCPQCSQFILHPVCLLIQRITILSHCYTAWSGRTESDLAVINVWNVEKKYLLIKERLYLLSNKGHSKGKIQFWWIILFMGQQFCWTSNSGAIYVFGMFYIPVIKAICINILTTDYLSSPQSLSILDSSLQAINHFILPGNPIQQSSQLTTILMSFLSSYEGFWKVLL